MENITTSGTEPRTIELNESAINELTQTRKWTMFLSILGFVLLSLMLVIIIIALAFSGNSMSGAGISALTMLPLLPVSAIYFFPIYFLFQFSKSSKQAFENNDPTALSKALKFLKYHYKFMGILVIVILAIYIVFGLVMAIGGGMQSYY